MYAAPLYLVRMRDFREFSMDMVVYFIAAD
jgi:hypothetical protein